LGVAAALAALAAACGDGDRGQVPTPPTSLAAPAPSPSPQVAITLLAARPPSGSTVGAREPVPVSLDLQVVSSQATPGSFLRVELVNGGVRCLAAEVRGPALQANVTAVFTAGPFVTDPPFVACAIPFTTTGVNVRFFNATDPTFLTPTGTAQLSALYNFR
jgi:hypothetical protein